MTKKTQRESKLQTTVSDYMKQKYPFADFLCDVAAGMKLTIFMATLVKRWRSRSGLPDMYIFEPRGDWSMLCLELKSSVADLYKKDGTLRKNEHLENQSAVHRTFCNKGYLCLFTKGFDHTRAVIDWYMDGAVGDPPKYVEKKNLFS